MCSGDLLSVRSQIRLLGVTELVMNYASRTFFYKSLNYSHSNSTHVNITNPLSSKKKEIPQLVGSWDQLSVGRFESGPDLACVGTQPCPSWASLVAEPSQTHALCPLSEEITLEKVGLRLGLGIVGPPAGLKCRILVGFGQYFIDNIPR